MKKLAFLLLLIVPCGFAQTTIEKCQARACYGYGAPTGGSQNGMIYQDLSQSPPVLSCGQGGAWVSCGGSGSGSGNVAAIPQAQIYVQPNSVTSATAGQSTTALNAQAPQINSIKDASQFCTTPGTLDDSCITNALSANQTIQLKAGTYNLANVVNITQSGVTLKCLPGAILQQGNATQGIHITGNNSVMDGCTINTNNQPNQVIEAGAVGGGITNFSFINGAVNNTGSNYGIRVDSSTNVNFLNNQCNGSNGGGCGQIFASSNVNISGNKGTGYFNVQSPSTGGSGNAVTFTSNSLTPEAGGTIFTLGDFSGGFNPIGGVTIANNHCTITGTSSGSPAFGCFSIVGNVSKCAITNNTMDAAGQYLSAGLMELGVNGCPVTGNVFNSPDTHTQAYYGVIVYGAGNTIASNSFNGWGTSGAGSAIRFYPQTSAGAAFNGDNNLVIGNTMIATGAEPYALSVDCNVVGSSENSLLIVGNSMIGGSGFARAMSISDDVTSCPVSTNIHGNHIKNATIGIITANVTGTFGVNDFQSVTTNYQPIGTSTTSNAQILSPVVTPSITPTGLTPSIQGLCYPTANSPITNAGCAQINQGVVTFTPTAVGWYRIVSGATVGFDRGNVEIYGTEFGGSMPTNDIAFSLNSNAGPSAIKITNLGVYGGNYGPIDMVRGSNDGGAHTYLDIHVSTISSVQPLTLTFTGLGIPTVDIVASPVVGAVAGSSDVAVLDFTTFSTNPATGIVSSAETGLAYALGFNAATGFQIGQTAPLNHCLIGNGTFYLDSSSCGLTNPMSALGDFIYGGASGAPTRLAGPTSGSLPYYPCETPGTAPTFCLPGIGGRTVTTTSDTISATDRASVVTYNSASAVAVTLTSAATIGNNFDFAVWNEGAGAATFTPGAGTINGGSTLVVNQGENCAINSPDSTNYVARCSSGQVTVDSTLTVTRSASGVQLSINAIYNLVQTSGSPYTLLGLTGTYWNNTASAYTFQLDAPVSGKQYCFGNYQARSGVITIKSTTSVTIYFKGVAGTTGTGGSLVSGGAAGDFICLEGTDSTTYIAVGSGVGTWTNN